MNRSDFIVIEKAREDICSLEYCLNPCEPVWASWCRDHETEWDLIQEGYLSERNLWTEES